MIYSNKYSPIFKEHKKTLKLQSGGLGLNRGFSSSNASNEMLGSLNNLDNSSTPKLNYSSGINKPNTNMSATAGMKSSAGSAVMGAAAGIADSVVESGGQLNTQFDETGEINKANIKTANSRKTADAVGTGIMSTASMFGPWGMAVGGILKGIQVGLTQSGAFDTRLGNNALKDIGNIRKSKADSVNKQMNNNYYGDLNKMSKATYQYSKGGIYRKLKYKKGAVILGGYRHHEKNELGDKGNPIVNNKGEKVAETEREELLMSKEQTNRIESLHLLCKLNPNENNYFKLGEEVRKIILNETIDNSGKFKYLN